MSQIKIQVMDDFYSQSHASLHLLYRPLIGNEACALYEILISLPDRMYTMEQLEAICFFPSNTFIHARKKLEQFHLVKTYYANKTKEYIFQVFAPLRPLVFLKHDTYSRMYLQMVGSHVFDQMKSFFALHQMDVEGYQDISEQIDVSMLNQWDEHDEIQYEKVKPKQEDALKEYDFNFALFLQGMDNILPIQLRTTENLSRIASLASIYGLNEKKMKTYVMRSINPNTKYFDLGRLQELVSHSTIDYKRTKDPYRLAPVQYLAYKQRGAAVAAADRKLIERMIQSYHFSNEVMNVLIDFVLKQTNQQFPKAYVEKVAATWSRLNVDSKEKALKQISTPAPTPSKGVPEWYTNTEIEKPSEDLLKQAIEAQKALKGDSNESY